MTQSESKTNSINRTTMHPYNKAEPSLPYQGYPYKKPTLTDPQPTNAEGVTSVKPQRDNRPYQGYPYVKPIVTDVPSLNPGEVAALTKWRNLPRKPLVARDDWNKQSSSLQNDPTPDHNEGCSRPSISKDEDFDRPVVYIDIPQGSPGLSDRIPDDDQIPGPGCTKDPGSNTDSGSGHVGRLSEWEDLDRPVVYIDIPEGNGSEVSQSMDREEPAYVQETIFYDQFKDRRIEDSHGSHPGSPRPHRLAPPDLLHIASPGSSGFGSASSSSPYTNHTQSPYQTKETNVYGRQPSPDDFNLAPLPVNDFPAYPPPYSEIDVSGPAHQTQTPVTSEPPRTQVITASGSPPQSLILDGRRKLMRCQHCNETVQTLVVKENGFYTHLLACLVCIIFLPLIILVYCFDCFKYRNHYCPACNKKIGYNNPATCFSDHFSYTS